MQEHITIRWVAAKVLRVDGVRIRACSLGIYNLSCALWFNVYSSQETDTSSLQAFSNQWSLYQKAINLLHKIE